MTQKAAMPVRSSSCDGRSQPHAGTLGATPRRDTPLRMNLQINLQVSLHVHLRLNLQLRMRRPSSFSRMIENWMTASCRSVLPISEDDGSRPIPISPDSHLPSPAPRDRAAVRDCNTRLYDLARMARRLRRRHDPWRSLAQQIRTSCASFGMRFGWCLRWSQRRARASRDDRWYHACEPDLPDRWS